MLQAIANIRINGEKIKDIPLRSCTIQIFPLLPLPFNIILDVHAIASRPKNIKVIQIEKKEFKLSVLQMT